MGILDMFRKNSDPILGQTWTGKVSKKTPISNIPIVVFDTELTGLNLKKDHIISIGAIKMTGGRIHPVDEFYTLVKAPIDLKKDNVLIHRITPDELKEAKTIEQVLPDFFEFIQDSILMGHFVHIDVNFVNKFSKIHFNGKIKNPSVDTSSLHDWILDNDSNFKKHYKGGSMKTDLFSLAERYGIEITKIHNAMADAFITARLYQRFHFFLKKNGILTLNNLLDVGK